MSIKKYKPEQIIAVLRQIEVQMANGKTAPQACNPHADLLPVAEGIRRAEGGAGKRLKELETENGRLKRLVAELSLEKQGLQEVAEGNF